MPQHECRFAVVFTLPLLPLTLPPLFVVYKYFVLCRNSVEIGSRSDKDE